MFLAGGPLLSALIHARLAKRRYGIIARKYTRVGGARAHNQGKSCPQVSFSYIATEMRENKGDASAMPDVKLEITSRLLSHLNHCRSTKRSSFNRFTSTKTLSSSRQKFFSRVSFCTDIPTSSGYTLPLQDSLIEEIFPRVSIYGFRIYKLIEFQRRNFRCRNFFVKIVAVFLTFKRAI